MNNYDADIKTSSASILDKTDWRKTIHRCLETCVKCEGTLRYPQVVKSLVSAVSAEYPGFDAKKMIDKEVSELKHEYSIEIKRYFFDNPDWWYHPLKRKFIEPKIINSYYKDVFEFVKNMLAHKRILLYGVRKTHGGVQMEDKE